MKREILIALFAAVILATTIWGYNFISGKNLFSRNYTFYAYYDNVQDVNTATSVQINGYEVGSVIAISPDPENIKRIRLEFTVKNSIKLPDYTIAELTSTSPLGGKSIELRFDKMCSGGNCAKDKSILKGTTIGILGAMLDSTELSKHMMTITSVIDKSLGDLGREDSQEAIDVSIRSLASSLENFASITDKFNSLLSNSSKDMEKTFSNMAELTSSLMVSNEKINGMLDNLSDLTADLKSVKLSETIESANGTFTQAESSLKTLESTMSEANLTLAELTDIFKKISAGEGSMGKLMHDEELYENIESTTKNLDLLIEDIRLNPRRYFRLFGKKSKDYENPALEPSNSEGGK